MASFLQELKRRKVVRVAIAYAAVAWLLMQVADVVIPAAGLGDAYLRYFLIGLVLGFPIVLVLAWLFEWTPEGISRDPQDVGQSDKSEIVGSLQFAELDSSRKSIAVLPFVNLSKDLDQEYFCDGLVEDIITDLSTLPSILVISRNTTSKYKGSNLDARHISTEIGADYILRGSVRIISEQIRVTAQLIDCGADTNIWSKKFNRDLSNIHKIQDEVTASIVEAMDVKLVSGEHGRLRRQRYKTQEGGEALYRGIHHMLKWDETEFQMAEQYFDEFVTIEPDSILGYIWHIYNITFGLIVGWVDPEVALPKLKHNIDKGLTINDSDPMVLIGDSIFQVLTGDHDGALSSVAKAADLSPNLDFAFQTLGWVQFLSGDAKSAVRSLKRSCRLSPVMSAVQFGLLGTAFRNAGMHEEAIEVFQTSLKQYPGFYHAHIGLATVYGVLGEKKKAKKQLAKALVKVPDYSVKKYVTPNLYKDKSEFEYWGNVLRELGLAET